MKDVTGIILAGGKSSRMGSDKGLVLINGKPMIQYIIDELQSMDIPVVIIANNPEYEKFNLPVFEDLIKDKGPIGGIYTGLANSTTTSNLILSCDVPFVSIALLNYLLENSKNSLITIPKFGSKTHPLIGVYKTNIKETAANYIAEDKLKLRLFCDDLNCNIVNIENSTDLYDATNFLNINSQQELINLKL